VIDTFTAYIIGTNTFYRKEKLCFSNQYTGL